jgi:hypothetical protein
MDPGSFFTMAFEADQFKHLVRVCAQKRFMSFGGLTISVSVGILFGDF